MDKILVKVYVPALQTAMEVYLPLRSRGYEVLELLKKTAQTLSEGQFCGNAQTALCRREDGTVLNINLSVFELELRNGSELMLI